MARASSVERICSEPECGARITHQSKTGRCRPCALSRMHADPEYQRARRAGLAAYFGQPGTGAAHNKKMLAGRLHPTPEEQERRRSHGQWLYANHASRAEVFAKSQSPSARERATEKYVERRLAWCPPPLRAAYRDLIRVKRLPAAEARRVIEAQIPGSIEHARIEIANRELAARLRHERQVQEDF